MEFRASWNFNVPADLTLLWKQSTQINNSITIHLSNLRKRDVALTRYFM